MLHFTMPKDTYANTCMHVSIQYTGMHACEHTIHRNIGMMLQNYAMHVCKHVCMYVVHECIAVPVKHCMLCI